MVLLSEKEQIIAEKLSNNISIKDIAKSVGTTVQYIYKIRNKLAQNGIKLKNENFGLKSNVAESKSGLKSLRLHNIQLNVKIIYKTKYYDRQVKNCNIIKFKGSTVHLYDNKLEIYTDSENSFIGKTTWDIYKNATEYLSKLFYKIENRCKITITKDEYLNVNWVRQHIAEMDSETAKNVHNRDEELAIRSPEDGKTWLITDKSFNGNELEFVHSKTAKQDTEKVERILNDIRDNDTLTLTELEREILTKDLELRRYLTIFAKNDAEIKEIQLKELKERQFMYEGINIKEKPYYVG